MNEKESLRCLPAIGLVLLLGIAAGCGGHYPESYSFNVELVGDFKTIAWDVCLQDNYAFVATEDKGLLVLDVSQPKKPETVSSFIPGDITKAVKVEGDRVYLLTDTGRYPSGNTRLHILDISNPYQLQRLGECYLGASAAFDIVVRNGYAYVGSGNLYVVNVSDSSGPLVAKELYLGGGVSAIDITDSLAYCTVQTPYLESELSVLDISDPLNTEILKSYEASQRSQFPYSFAFDVATQDSCLFIATERGLQIIDITQPSRPRELSFFPLYRSPLSFSALDIADTYIYLIYSTTGFQVIDISDPIRPSEAGYYNLPGRDMGKLCGEGSYAYVASFYGLYLFKFTG